MKVAIVDANEKTQERLAGSVVSLVGLWLRYELEKARCDLVAPPDADVVFLVHAGTKYYGDNVRSELRRFGIEPFQARRHGAPYVITGGEVATNPFLALRYADALAVGEAYRFLDEIIRLLKAGTVDDIRRYAAEYPHAIEAAQVACLARDVGRPWLLAEPAPTLACPDPDIDWYRIPTIKADDNVIRLLASKGCRGRCLFCATTWGQAYQVNPAPARMLRTGKKLHAQGERAMLLSNDPAALPWIGDVELPLDSESFTVRQLADPVARRLLRRLKIKRARFGVEGVSERLRRAWGKPIANDVLFDLITDLMNHYRVGTHMFFIVGAPFETDADWAEFREFYYKLARNVEHMLCRLKFTTFSLCPPAPLSRFLPAAGYYERFAATYDWLCKNAANRHFMQVKPRMAKALVKENAEELGIGADLAERMTLAGNFDLAPTPDDALRLPWEIVEWPMPALKRWRMAEGYRLKVGRVEWAAG